MKQYPHIEYFCNAPFGETVWAFDKIDGSQIRTEWNRKLSKKSNFTNGFSKFGTRGQLINKTSEAFGDSVNIFMDKYSEDLNKIFRTDKDLINIDTFTVYLEYCGENSFAGRHQATDLKNLVLFDIEAYKKGFITPKNYIEKFGHLDIAELIYHGELTKEFINDVYEGKYDLTEGVVCKGVRKTKGSEVVWMCKCKTKIWLERVKEKLGEKALKDELNGELIL
jgi:hypothetical protein